MTLLFMAIKKQIYTMTSKNLQHVDKIRQHTGIAYKLFMCCSAEILSKSPPISKKLNKLIQTSFNQCILLSFLTRYPFFLAALQHLPCSVPIHCGLANALMLGLLCPTTIDAAADTSPTMSSNQSPLRHSNISPSSDPTPQQPMYRCQRCPPHLPSMVEYSREPHILPLSAKEWASRFSKTN